MYLVFQTTITCMIRPCLNILIINVFYIIFMYICTMHLYMFVCIHTHMLWVYLTWFGTLLKIWVILKHYHAVIFIVQPFDINNSSGKNAILYINNQPLLCFHCAKKCSNYLICVLLCNSQNTQWLPNVLLYIFLNKQVRDSILHPWNTLEMIMISWYTS